MTRFGERNRWFIFSSPFFFHYKSHSGYTIYGMVVNRAISCALTVLYSMMLYTWYVTTPLNTCLWLIRSRNGITKWLSLQLTLNATLSCYRLAGDSPRLLILRESFSNQAINVRISSKWSVMLISPAARTSRLWFSAFALCFRQPENTTSESCWSSKSICKSNSAL